MAHFEIDKSRLNLTDDEMLELAANLVAVVRRRQKHKTQFDFVSMPCISSNEGRNYASVIVFGCVGEHH